MATLNDVISCYNELVDEVNGHTASIERLRADVPTLTARIEDAMASLTTKLSQLEARLDELVQEHDVMMDTISSLLAAPTVETVELKRVEKKKPVVEEEKTVELKRVEKKKPVEKKPVVEEEKTTVEEEKTTVELKRVEKPVEETTVELKPTPAPAPKRAPAPKPTEIQKRAFARQYMVEHGAKVEDLRSPERINETIASDEFTAWMNAR